MTMAPRHTQTDETDDDPAVLTAVSCGSSKKNIAGIETVPARELYDSPAHTCKDRFGRHSAGYYIMSARHGLIHYSERIGYYDELLDNKSDEEIRQWGREVADDLASAVAAEGYDAVVLIGSKTYVEAVLPHASQLAVPVLTPWQTDDYVTGIGCAMSWCTDESNWPTNIDDIQEIGEKRTDLQQSGVSSDA